MTIGPLAFLSPWLLTGLLALPLIWWLLRATPPRPQQIAFPATRILKDLINREQTPARTPWWLLLLRLLAAAALIAALAQPILNPRAAMVTGNSGPIAVVVDTGWAAAAEWPKRKDTLLAVLREADATGRSVALLETASVPGAATLDFVPASDALASAEGLAPRPYPADRLAALSRLETLVGAGNTVRVVWLADAIDYGSAAGAIERFVAIAGGAGNLMVVSSDAGETPRGVRRVVDEDRGFVGEVVGLANDTGGGVVHALSRQGQRLAEASFRLAPVEDGAMTSARVTFDVPLEIANQISRLEIAGELTAGGVHLLDARSQFQRVGLVAGTDVDRDQPLLAPLYYLTRALGPHAELVATSDANTSTAIETALKRRVTTLMLANVGTVGGASQDQLSEWVNGGGVLVRFAGPRLENGDDDLLPVALRRGGRTLGGALSWSQPQPLQAFDADSPFAGLRVPPEVTVNRQVLADPAALGLDVAVWARLVDGTPLVTARALGEGWIVLFHVTANSDWSNLPLSGLFVEMLRQIITVSNLTLTGKAAGNDETQSEPDGADDSRGAVAGAREGGLVLAPRQTLDGFGVLRSPPGGVRPVVLAELDTTPISATHPPGFYGLGDATRSLNLVSDKTTLTPLPALPSGAVTASYAEGTATPLKPWLFLFALAALAIDVIATMVLQSGGRVRDAARSSTGAPAGRTATTASVTAWLAAPLAVAMVFATLGGVAKAADKVDDAFALAVSLDTRFAYVVTGDQQVDRTSELGLSGLSRRLSERTAIEPAGPIGVDIMRDELAFFPIIYWPVLEDAQALSDAAVARVDAYMKSGGMLIFDTRDTQLTFGGNAQGPGARALQRLLARMDVPRIEPVPEGHVLTKSFYLLSSFPGRWDGGPLWTEAAGDVANAPGRAARRADGVSSILITGNDLAGAWAADESGRALYAVVPGGEWQRELAYRTGINIAMYALTGNYKADQVHIPALLERLGQ